MKKHLLLGSIMILAAGIISGGCKADTRGKTITIGSKNFTEQLLIGEIMAQMIEEETDLEVARKFNLGGTMICHNALLNGGIDLYAEYTGTALTAILKKDTVSDPEKAYRTVAEAYGEKYKCRWLNPFGFNNTYAITVRSDFARKHNLTNISDLAAIAGDLTAGFTAEFMEREDGYPGLKEAYEIKFKTTKDMEPSLMYRAIDGKDVDVICAFATDGRIAAYDLKMLRDDKMFFPPYYAAPVIRMDLLEKHPQISSVLQPLAGLLNDKTMQELNLEVDAGKKEPAAVAREFLIRKNILPDRDGR